MRAATVMCMAATLGSVVFVASCGQSDAPASLNELQRVRSANLDVVLLSSNRTVRTGKDTYVVEFRSAVDGQLVDVGEVKASAMMPMPGMGPMAGAIEVRATDVRGRYAVTSALSMAGDWRFTFEWNGSSGRGSAMLSASAQ